MYTEEQVKLMIQNAKEKETPQFHTSTPTKDEESPIPRNKNPRKKHEEEPTRFSPRIEAKKSMEASANASVLDQVKKAGVKDNKKRLFHENDEKEHGDVSHMSEDVSLETIAPVSPMAKVLNDSVKAQIWEADMNAHTRKIIEDSSKIIVEEHQKISLDILKTQTQLVENTKQVAEAVSESVCKSARDVSESVTASVSKSAKEMSESVTAAIKKQFEEAQEIHDENTEALAVIEEKLGEKLLTYQIKMIKNLEKVGSAVTNAAAKIAASQETMIKGIVSMADGLTKMATGMDQLMESTANIKNNHISCVDMLGKADEVMKKLTHNMEYLSDAQEKINKEHVARALISCEYITFA